MNRSALKSGVLIFSAFVVACSTEKSSTDYIKAASTYLEKNQIQAAVIESRNAVKADTSSAEARKLLGRLELRIANPENSEKELRKAIELGLPAEDVAIELSKALLDQRKFDELLNMDLQQVPEANLPLILANQANAHLANGDTKQANILANEALAINSKSGEAMLVLAKTSAYNRNFSMARENTNSAISFSPEYAAAWEFLGSLEMQEENYEQAVAALDNAVKFSDNKLAPLLSRAQAYIKLERFDDALADYDRLTDANVNHPIINLGRSEILFNKGQYAESQVQQEEALKLYPDFIPAMRSLAFTHFKNGNLGQAEQYAKQYLLATNSAPARTLLGAIRLQNKRFEQAQETLEPLVSSRSMSVTATQLLSSAYLKQGKHEEAIELMLNMHRAYQNSGAADIPVFALDKLPAEAFSDGSSNSTENDNSAAYLSPLSKQIIDITRLLGSRDVSNATIAINELQKAEPTSALPHSLMGRVHLLNNDASQAMSAFKKAVDMDKNAIIPTIMLAELLRADDPETATSLLEDSLSFATGSARERLMLTLAGHAQRDQNSAEMLNWMTKSKQENRQAFNTNLALARHHIALGNNKEVIEAISDIEESNQQIPFVAEIKVEALLNESQFDDAIALLEQLIQQSPDAPQWYYLRARAHAGNKNTTDMQDDLDRALLTEPEHFPSLLATANLNISLNKLDAAESYIDRIESIAPKSDALETVKGRFVKAKLSPSEEATTEQYQNTQEVLNGVKEYWKVGERDRAVQLMKKWLEVNPSDVVIWITLANIYGVLEQIPDSIQAYQEALKLSPDNFVALNNLAWHLRDSEPEQALMHVRRALETQPDNISTIDTLAVILFEQGKLEEAKDAFEKTQRLGASDPSIMYHGALIEHALGNVAKAKEILTPIIEDKISFPEREQAIIFFESL